MIEYPSFRAVVLKGGNKMNAEYVDTDSTDIIIIMEHGDYKKLHADMYTHSMVSPLVADVFESLANAIDFEIEQFMDDCGYFYGFGEPLYYGNSYATYPFIVPNIDGSDSLYEITQENLDELVLKGKTVLTAN